MILSILRVVGKILKVGSVRAPSTHQMIHVILHDGRELLASPGHPTADNRILGNLKTGDFLDGAEIVLIDAFLMKELLPMISCHPAIHVSIGQTKS